MDLEKPSSADRFIGTIAEKLGAVARAATVFGDPVEQDGITVIPVAKARWGFGGGGGQRKDEGSGGKQEDGAGGGGGAPTTTAGVMTIGLQPPQPTKLYCAEPVLDQCESLERLSANQCRSMRD